MPGKVKVKIISGRNLPVMDRSSDTTDAYVEIKLGTTTYKTDVCRKSLHPQWNSDWYRFEVDDSELQDEPLQIRLMDHDTYSANDAIGKVYLDLNPLLLPAASLLIKYNEAPAIPHGFYAQVIHGFVEELVVNDDPEYQWIDKIRTPRASNEARQTLFFKLSGELQRKIGVKALDLGGNAVVGYNQSFDLEGESGIVARGIGTAVTLVKLMDMPVQNVETNLTEERAQNYLKFLGSAKGFFLSNDTSLNIKNIMPTPQPSPIPSIRSLRLDEYNLTRHLSDKEFNIALKPPTSEVLLHHSASLQTLLRQEDQRGKPGYGLSQRIKNLKYTSQNLLSRKMLALKAKRRTDLFTLESINKRKVMKYRRTQSDSMAEILVMSVIHGTSSLDCISESPGKQQEMLIINEPSSLHIESSTSYRSLPSSTTGQSNLSSSSSQSSSLDDEYNTDENDNRELDTVSHIVETVRKLSMIQPTPSQERFLMVLEDDLIELDPSCTNSLSDYEMTADDNDNDNDNDQKAEKNNFDFFCAQLSHQFRTMRKSPSSCSLTDHGGGTLAQHAAKFTSLHNIYDASCKLNKYSAHEGKETVLGELFKRVQSASSSTIKNVSVSSKELLCTDVADKHGLFDKILKGPKEFLHKIRHHDSQVKHHGLLETALGNVLMDSANISSATSKNIKAQQQQQQQPSSYNRSMSLPVDNSESNKVQIKQRFLSSKDALLRGPKSLFQRLDSKFHHKKSAMKNDGLLNTALGNVLMDSVNEVLATSHLSSDEKNTSSENKSNNAINADKSIISNAMITPSIVLERLDKQRLSTSTSPINNLSLRTDLCVENKHFYETNFVPIVPLTNNLPNTVVPPSNTINTELDSGSNIVGINTMHACLTQTRINDTPPKEIVKATTAAAEMGHQRTESVGTRMSHSPAKLNAIPCIHRRSSDSDLSITPKGNSLTGSDRSGGGCSSGQFSRTNVVRTTVPHENFDILEYPFLTMSKYPSGFISYIGGAVSARSVKLLERITNLEEPESRDTWWSEIRMEIRSHARALNCNSVLGYTETTSICDDVCVLSASGTAAVIGYQYQGEASDNLSGLPIIPKANSTTSKDMMTTSLDRNDFEKEKPIKAEVTLAKAPIVGSPEKDAPMKPACNICHLPYVSNNMPLRNTTTKCAICRIGKVPDMLIATIEIPDNIPSVGRGCFIQSYVCRPLRDLKGESNAKEISDGLPFLEYELHRLLVNKLKVKGMNAVFGLKVRISVGERMLIGIATGTAVFLSPLPSPPLPKLISDRTTDEQKLAQLQKSLHDTVKMNKEIYQLRLTEEPSNGKFLSDNDDSEEEQTSLDLSIGNKDCCILEVDDPEDVDVLNSLMEPRPPDGFHVVNTEHVPGLEELEIVKNLQMFTQIWRAKIQPPHNLDKHFHRLLQSVYFKLRRMIPCALCDLQFRVDSPEPDEIQLCVLGMALGLGDPQQKPKAKRKNVLPKRNDDELIFNLEEDQIPELNPVPNSNYLHTQTLKYRQKSPIRSRLLTRQRHVPYRERHGVDITPLSYVPGGKIEKYLGNLNFFFIRETTSIREEGGLSGFIHSFITEILAIVRAHVTALGGNAMVAYFMTECVLNHNLHKNQGQCLINVGGDVVYVSYYSEDH